MDYPWPALRLCDFCGSNAVAIAPKVGDSEYDVKWIPVCMDHIMSWWSEEIPLAERLPAFLLPAAPDQFPEHPIYETQPIDPEEWARLCGLLI
jgi:hypothetical protein